MADKANDTVVVYNEATGKPMSVPKSHEKNYIGKGYTNVKPKKTEDKEQ